MGVLIRFLDELNGDDTLLSQNGLLQGSHRRVLPPFNRFRIGFQMRLHIRQVSVRNRFVDGSILGICSMDGASCAHKA